MAIGLGANLGIFGVVNALLFRSLPFLDPIRLASLSTFSRLTTAPRSFTHGSDKAGANSTGAGVESASATEFLPLYATAFVGGPFQLHGRPATETPALIPVLPDFSKTMGVKILAGHELNDGESRNNDRVAPVNERFASQFGPAVNALGYRLTIGNAPPGRSSV